MLGVIEEQTICDEPKCPSAAAYPQLTFTPQPAMPRPKDVSRSDSAVELLQMVHRGKRHVAHAMNVTWTHLSCYFSVLKTHTIQRKCQSPLKRAARFANCVVELLGAKL